MAKSAERFGYFGYVLFAPECNQYPFNPYLVIEVANVISGEDDFPRLSSNLVTESEIDYHIEQRKEELDALGKAAKLALRKEKNKLISELQRRRSD